jgi:hypothetical protein
MSIAILNSTKLSFIPQFRPKRFHKIGSSQRPETGQPRGAAVDEPDFSRPKSKSDEESEFSRLLHLSAGKRVTPSPLKRLSGLVNNIEISVP